MVKPTQEKLKDLINQLHQRGHIDGMTKKRLLQTSNLPRIPIQILYKYYTNLQKSTNLTRLVDPSSWVVTALLNKYTHFWIHCSSLSHRNN